MNITLANLDLLQPHQQNQQMINHQRRNITVGQKKRRFNRRVGLGVGLGLCGGNKMSAIRAATVAIANKVLNLNAFLFPPIVHRPFRLGIVGVRVRILSGGISRSDRVRCLSSEAGGGKKASSRLSQMRQMMQEAEERAFTADDEPTPQITLEVAALEARM